MSAISEIQTPVYRQPLVMRFLTARVLMSFAAQMQDIAIGWYVYSETSSALSLGFVGLSQFAPMLLLAGVAGDVADRKDRKLIAWVCNIGQVICSLAMFGFAFFPVLGIWPIYGCLAGLGICRAFSAPTLSSILPNLVEKSQFSRAIAVSSSAFQIATIAGPAAGGLLYAAIGKFVFVFAAILYATSAVAISGLPKIVVQHMDAGLTATQRMLAGVKYIFTNKMVLGALSLDLFAVLLGGVTALLPIYARDILHVGPDGLGLLRGCPALGAATIGLLLTRTPLKRGVGTKMFACVAGFGVATIVFAVSTSIPLSVLALVLMGAFDMVSVVIRQTLVQMATPDAMRGRVTAINFVFIGASNQLGEFESGITAALFGTVPAALIGGIGTVLIVGLWALLFPELRKADAM